MKLNSQKGYSVLEVGIGLIIITVFLIAGITMLKGTYANYRLVEQKNIAMTYLIKGIERELLSDSLTLEVIDDLNKTVTVESTENREVKVTNIDANNMILTTTFEKLTNKDGKDYSNSRIRLITASIEFYTSKNDPSTRRVIELKTYKILDSKTNRLKGEGISD